MLRFFFSLPLNPQVFSKEQRCWIIQDLTLLSHDFCDALHHCVDACLSWNDCSRTTIYPYIQAGRSLAEHPSMEQGNSQPLNKQRTFSVVAREILTQFQVWQRACYSRNIEWGPITAKIISALPQLYGREAEVIVRCTKMLHNRRDYLRRRAKMHCTIFQKGEMPCISKCTVCCDKHHCPFCETWIYKPRELGSVINHVQNHLKLAVQHDDFTIVKCNLKCRENAHFHCCYCSATLLRKCQFKIHLTNCKQKLEADEQFEEKCSLDETEELE